MIPRENLRQAHPMVKADASWVNNSMVEIVTPSQFLSKFDGAVSNRQQIVPPPEKWSWFRSKLYGRIEVFSLSAETVV